MRAGIESWLLGHWYGTGQPPWYLRMLEPVYRAAYQAIQKNKQDGPAKYRSGLPLIVVGNITAGGSGKTPLVIRLCQIAVDMNLKPGIASTGYGRHCRTTLLVQPDSDTDLCGDEPVLLASRTGVPVVVASNRLDAVKMLNKMDLDLIFSDDGLQQADLDRDIEFCVVDGVRGLGNGHLIPAGPLREPAERLRQVDFVVTNGEWGDRPDDVDMHEMHLHANVVRSLDNSTEYPVDEFRHNKTGIPAHAVAGIGHPQRFFRMLEALGIQADPHGFPDHHSFKREDFDSITPDTVIIMTEKDAVKCRSLGLANAWYVPVETLLPVEFETIFKDKLAELMRDNK
ncbi:MAG: tetraacyldisaccharide 4'-kinase [Gammaproteobacteria bacterium]|nr:tetraacyldisaccharide 4'-kinase [Gammaproteobacteria bacterium]